MTEAKIFVEGGGPGLDTRCREGVTKLLDKCGFTGRLPRIVACGSRNQAYDDFSAEHKRGVTAFVALLVDSEEPVVDNYETWAHLKARDKWDCPAGATDAQVFLMTTCMETWIIADQAGLKRHYERHKRCVHPAGLPASANLETQDRHNIQNALITATRDCSNAYEKNERSYEAFANVDPAVLRKVLPAFDRMVLILERRLPTRR